MVRLKGDMLLGEPCTRLPWKKRPEPAGPVGATMPPSATSREMVSLSMVHKG